MVISLLGKCGCALRWKPVIGEEKKPTCCIFHGNATPDSFGFITVTGFELLGLFLYTYVTNNLKL